MRVMRICKSARAKLYPHCFAAESKTSITGKTSYLSSKKLRELMGLGGTAGSHQKIPLPSPRGVFSTNRFTFSRNFLWPSGVSGKGAALLMYSVGFQL